MAELSGRIEAVPAAVWHEEVLAPQFAAEVAALLRVRGDREGLLARARPPRADRRRPDRACRRRCLAGSRPRTGRAPTRPPTCPTSPFALERHVADGDDPPPAWHVDRSRNDFQAAAQLLTARDWPAGAAEALDFAGPRPTGRAAGRPADAGLHPPTRRPRSSPPASSSPRSSQRDPADVAARCGPTTTSSTRARWARARWPGQELAWDRDRMAAAARLRAAP